MKAHGDFMRRCLELASQAKARGDVPVGSLVVRGDVILAEASEALPTTLNITGHAEILAVQTACDALGTTDLSGCTLYTTAEPCWMCTYAIRETRIARVVYGTPTRDVGGLSTTYKLLIADDVPGWGPPPEIVGGVLEAECAAIRES